MVHPGRLRFAIDECRQVLVGCYKKTLGKRRKGHGAVDVPPQALPQVEGAGDGCCSTLITSIDCGCDISGRLAVDMGAVSCQAVAATIAAPLGHRHHQNRLPAAENLGNFDGPHKSRVGGLIPECRRSRRSYLCTLWC